MDKICFATMKPGQCTEICREYTKCKEASVDEFGNYPKPIQQHTSGGTQDLEEYDYSLLPQEAIHLIVLNMTRGARKHGIDNYLLLGQKENSARAVAHLQLAEMKNSLDYSDDSDLVHLVNGATRSLFALNCYLQRNEAVMFDMERNCNG